MFRSVLVLGTIRGIRIEIHVSWLVIFALLMASLHAGLGQTYPDWSTTTVMVTALSTVLLFFTSIVAHELGHSLVAIRRGVGVEAITLFIFGGMAQITRDAESASDEFWIAVAGPLVSIGLALLFTLASVLAAAFSEPAAVALGWLGVINLVVAVFNLIPGFPLDGGRVLRAIVWRITGDARKGMRAAVMGGRLVAYGLFAFGLWQLLVRGNLIGGLWIMVIAWFLLNAAEASGRSFGLGERLKRMRARDLAERDVPFVSPATSVADWVEKQVLPTSLRAAFVGDRESILGLVTLGDARGIARERWRSTRVADVMTPADRLLTVQADSDAEQVMRLINSHRLNQVPVMEGSRLFGWIERQHLLAALAVQMEAARTDRGGR